MAVRRNKLEVPQGTTRRRPSEVIAGFLTYIAIFGLTVVWVLGWMGLSVVVGSFFGLPLRTVMLVGATLGPLGFMVTIMIGILESRNSGAVTELAPQASLGSESGFEDPFSI